MSGLILLSTPFSDTWALVKRQQMIGMIGNILIREMIGKVKGKGEPYPYDASDA